MRLLTQSKLAIYPTRLDAFPLSVLETLSCGTSVIAYAIPAIRFNYADTRAVIKTKPLDIEEMTRRAIETLEGEAWRELGREAVEFAKKYTWENVAKTEWNTLQSIM
jgi:glycosyltransferase involved in cell wall biosynthesis